MEIERLKPARSAGELSAMNQRIDMGYQDFLRQQAFPREQLPLQHTQGLPFSRDRPQQPLAALVSRAIACAGIGGVGLYNATQGLVKAMNILDVEDMIKGLPDQRLQQEAEALLVRCLSSL